MTNGIWVSHSTAYVRCRVWRTTEHLVYQGNKVRVILRGVPRQDDVRARKHLPDAGAAEVGRRHRAHILQRCLTGAQQTDRSDI